MKLKQNVASLTYDIHPGYTEFHIKSLSRYYKPVIRIEQIKVKWLYTIDVRLIMSSLHTGHGLLWLVKGCPRISVRCYIYIRTFNQNGSTWQFVHSAEFRMARFYNSKWVWIPTIEVIKKGSVSSNIWHLMTLSWIHTTTNLITSIHRFNQVSTNFL